MERPAKSSARHPRNSPASEPGSTTATGSGRAGNPAQPQATRWPGEAIHDSPLMSAQHERIQRMFGLAAQGSGSRVTAAVVQGKMAPVQAYRTTRADDGGNFVGESGACHCHIDIGSPHFKVGKDQGSRINFGRDMNPERMQRAYEAMLLLHVGKAGFDDCKEYFEMQGCTAPDPGDKVRVLKGMLLRWGGLAEDKIHFYNDEGLLEERPVYSAEQLDETILEAEGEIRRYDNTYSDWLEEQAAEEEAAPEKNYHMGKKAIAAHQTGA